MALSEKQIQELKDAGLSDQDIIAYEQEQAAAAPVQAAPVDPNAPATNEFGEPILSETVPTDMGPVTGETSGIGTALGVAPYVLGGIGAGGTLYGAYRVGKNLLEDRASNTAIARENTAIARENTSINRLNAEAGKIKADASLIEAQRRAGMLPNQQPGSTQSSSQSGFQRGQFNFPQQPNVQTGMPGDITRAPAPAAERPVIFRQGQAQVPVQGPPTANNYMQRMNNLAEQYRGAQTVVQQQAPAARPAPAPAQPAPSGMTYRPIQGGGGGMRGGGGGGGGGGGLMMDPLNRRFRPMQY